jgi:hypothetical protein
MRPFAIALIVVAGFASAGCRAHPCGDRSADLPKVFGDAPLVSEGGKICDARESEATLMYWADKSKTNEIGVKLLAQMNAAGWQQYESNSEYAPRQDPEKPVYIFRRNDEEISARFSPATTPRFGAKLPAESLTIHLRHHVLTEKERRRR